jgi:HSP20 family protein
MQKRAAGANASPEKEVEMSENKTPAAPPARWSPFRELALPTRFGRLIDELFADAGGTASERALSPAIDVSEDDKQYVITAELPGVKKGDVSVELENGVLTVHGEKKSEREEKKERRRWVERSYGSFTRSLTLPGDALADRVDASFADGVLTVTIPKSEAAKPRTVAIK